MHVALGSFSSPKGCSQRAWTSIFPANNVCLLLVKSDEPCQPLSGVVSLPVHAAQTTGFTLQLMIQSAIGLSNFSSLQVGLFLSTCQVIGALERFGEQE